MEKKAAGVAQDDTTFAPVQQALDNMRHQLALFKQLSPGPMDAAVTNEVIDKCQQLLDQGVTVQLQRARQDSLDAYRQQANDVTPALSRAFGASTEAFNNVANKKLGQTRVEVDRPDRRD